MTNFISGPGLGLSLPQNLYPSELYNAPYDFANNQMGLAPGEALVIPAGYCWVDLCPYGGGPQLAVLQILDPVTGIWRGLDSSEAGGRVILSDGFTRRVANLTGCPVAAIVTGGGTGYAQATAVVTPSAGNSTWQPIVGGQLSVVSVGAAGAGYGIPPLVLLPAPPNPGVQATAYATISAGTVSGVTLSNVGAGYTTVPTAVIVPSPFDPSTPTSTATVVFNTVNAGAVTAVLCTNPGAAQANATAPTLTATGGSGSGATISAVMMQTVVSTSVSAAGFGSYGTSAQVITNGGVPTATPAYTNPAIEMNAYVPRPASYGLTLSAGTVTAVGTAYDTGLFCGTPTSNIISNGNPSSTAASVLLTMGGANTTVVLQPL